MVVRSENHECRRVAQTSFHVLNNVELLSTVVYTACQWHVVPGWCKSFVGPIGRVVKCHSDCDCTHNSGKNVFKSYIFPKLLTVQFICGIFSHFFQFIEFNRHRYKHLIGMFTMKIFDFLQSLVEFLKFVRPSYHLKTNFKACNS